MPNTYDFEGRVALVTGGVSGIGAAVAERLRAGGANVITFDRDASADVTGDMSRSADLDAVVTKAEADHGRLDILVNSAGIPGESLRTVDVTDDEWQQALNTYLLAAVLCCTMGLACSTFATSTARATVSNYLLIAAIVVLPLLAWLAAGTQPRPDRAMYSGPSPRSSRRARLASANRWK